MPDLNEALSQFLARRQQIVAQTLEKGGQQAEALLSSYGAPSQLDAIGSGLQQGVMHGFADDMERAERGDGVAVRHITAKASRPMEYEISALLGTMAAAGGLRLAQLGVSNAASSGARAGARVSGAAGGAAAAAKHGEAAKRIAHKVATLGMKPAHRGTVMDASHGAAWGYGGADVSRDEDAFSGERLLRAGLGAGASVIGAPVMTSAGVAAANAPLAFGGRRALSQKMLEPPGVVTKAQAFWNKVLNRNGPRQADPKGRPRDAIEIARSRDETAARGPVDIFTGKTQNPGIIARDTAPPMQSTQRNVQQLADQAIAPVAPARIADLKRQERNMSADAIERPYQKPAPAFQRDPALANLSIQDAVTYINAKHPPAAPNMTPPYFEAASVLKRTGGDRAAAKQELQARLQSAQQNVGGKYVSPVTVEQAKRVLAAVDSVDPMFFDDAAFNASMRSRVEAGGTAAMNQMGIDPPGLPQQMPLPFRTPEEEADAFVGQMMEAFTRQDRPALDSWVSTLQAAAQKNPAVMPTVKASVARQLAINERADPNLNNTPVMRDFLNALGLWGNKQKGTPNILDAARGPAAAKFPTGRYEDALTRTKGQTPMRPRHADNMRAEMETFEPGPYTGPADARRGPPTVARGDDEPYWLNPVDFFKEGKVNDAQVTAAGVLAGVPAWGAETYAISPAVDFMIGSPDHIRMPQQKPAGMLADIPPDAAPMPEPEPPLIPEPIAEPMAPPPAPIQQAQAPRGDDAVIREIQQVMIDAGFEVGGPDGKPDGIVGPLTQRAIEAFTMGAQLDLEDVLRRIRNYPRDRLAQILAE